MEKKIADYFIIERPFINHLVEEVLGMIEDGWEPLGAPYFYSVNVVKKHCQAMVKYSDPVQELDNLNAATA